MFYTAAWCTENEKKFREGVPLELLGQSLQRYHSTLEFTIVFLEGLTLLSDEYIQTLKNYGFSIIDYSGPFDEIKSRFRNIDQYYIRYERNCFLRWIAFKQLCSDNWKEHGQFWHMDSDVVMHTSLDALAEDAKGKTFMLQGCPVLLSVANPEWFDIYERELAKLDADIIGYSNEAASLKERCKQNDMRLSNQSLFRNPIGNDQDFLEYLISSRKIIQDSSDRIYASKYYYIQNILSLNVWHCAQAMEKDTFVEEKNLVIRIGGKQVPFIHYQNNFSSFASVYLFLDKLFVLRRFKKRILLFSIRDESFNVTLAYKIIFKLMRKLRLSQSREETIKELLEGNEQSRIVDLLNYVRQLDRSVYFQNENKQ